MHKSIWFQIHWFLGFVFGILLLIVGLSGAILSYEKEILQAINKDSYYVQVPQNQEKLKEAELLKIFNEKYPNEKINNIGFSKAPDSSTTINVVKEGERRGYTYYINPYNAEILPEIIGKDFFWFNFTLHRWLALDEDIRVIGKQAVALATIAAIVLTIGGIIVYWGRIKRHFFKSFTFSFKHKNRAFLSTMHSALGMWVVPFFLLMCLTGLYWSYDWYRGAMFALFQVEQPKREAPAPQQQAQDKNQAEARQGQGQREKKEQKQVIEFDNIVATIDTFNENVARDYKNATLRLNKSKDGTYTISYLYEDATHFRETNSMEINPVEKTVVKEAKFEDKKLNEQIMNSMLPLHSGEYFGWFGQLAYFISSTLMALFVITGYMLYYDRWKKKRAKALKEKAATSNI